MGNAPPVVSRCDRYCSVLPTPYIRCYCYCCYYYRPALCGCCFHHHYWALEGRCGWLGLAGLFLSSPPAKLEGTRHSTSSQCSLGELSKTTCRAEPARCDRPMEGDACQDATDGTCIKLVSVCSHEAIARFECGKMMCTTLRSTSPTVGKAVCGIRR